MNARLRDESGFAVVAAMLLTMIALTLGIALVGRVQGQQNQSKRERTRESSFNIAEAALSAQALQLTRAWPTNGLFPSSCTSASTNTACPLPSAVAGAYTGPDYGTACRTSPSTPAWTTSVRDNASGEQYWTTTVASRSGYDANNDGVLWVRSTGVAQCHTVSMVALASRSVIAMNFPANVATANWIATSNQGKKVIIDTLGAYAQPASIRPGPAAQPSSVVVRCAGLTQAQCKNYDAAKGQVQPPTVRSDSGASSSTLSLTQLQALENQAISATKFYPSGSCPTTAALLTGSPVYVEGPCNISITGSSSINSSASPGVLILENGTITLGGNTSFYGLLYAVNRQNSTGSVVTIQGNAVLQGVVAVDGPGGITAGSSKTNLIFDPRAPTLLQGEAGATIGKNTFRVLPGDTP